MAIFAVQYLEDSPRIATIKLEQAQVKLRAAFEQLPISLVLLGWNLPEALVNACAKETSRAGAQLFRWHPLLTGDGIFNPRPEWQTIGLTGEPVSGFQNMPEFTFVCPNRPVVQEAVLDHLREVIRLGHYQGIFLDRMRYPSPAANPAVTLACFCQDCRRAASEIDLDLEATRQAMGRLIAAPEWLRSFIQILLDPNALASANPDLLLFKKFLDFRAQSITQFIQTAAALIRAEGLAVGLDCFSPALTRLVGQELAALNACCDWIKIMSYGHTLGPAGIPFELLDLANWLVEQQKVKESEAMTWLSAATHLPLPASRAELRRMGLTPAALAAEVERGRAAGVRTLLAGIELVEIEGVTRLEPAQILADLQAFQTAGADGLVLSWDLWHIPVERLALVKTIWK